MDTKHGIPGLALGDPMSLVAQYSKDMQSALAPVAGRREGVQGSSTISNGGQIVTLGSFLYQYGVSPSSNGGITVPETGLYYIAAGLRTSNSVNDELQLRIYSAGETTAVQSSTGGRHFNLSTVRELNAGQDAYLYVYNNGSTNTIDDFFARIPYLSLYLISRT